MQNYLLKTKFNQDKSDQLKTASESVSLSVKELNEFFDSENDYLRNIGVQKVPSVVAIHEHTDGKKYLIHQTDNPYALATFNADADAKLTEFLANNP